MRNILFATAFSTHAPVAYRYAQRLAQYFGAAITLAHIYQVTKEEITSVSTEDRRKKELDRLIDFAAQRSAKQFSSIPLDFITIDGPIVDQLHNIQKENACDLLVIGTSRRSLREKWLGNTAQSLINKVKCPVLLIPPGASFLGIKELVYATAFSPGDSKAIDYLLDWCLAFNAKLQLLHIHQAANQAEAVAKIEALLNPYADERRVGLIQHQLLAGKVAPMMEYFWNNNALDLLTIQYRSQGFWQRMIDGSLTELLLDKSPIPILILK